MVLVDPTPAFDLSPYLYTQFMEPLGATDGSVESSWNHAENRWRRDLVEVTRELAPTLIRWGGCFASYYRWREGVGPRRRRVPMRNLLWGGVETNQVGTHEFVGFCRDVGADPLLVVNFESDGRRHWARPAGGTSRLGTAKEAAEWVAYCNDPGNTERRRNGAKKPFGVRVWQIGNETSYDGRGFDCETAARKTVRFARAMRKADPTITLIGWGDSGWAPRTLEVAGEHLDYLAFHNGYRSTLPDSPLNEDDYRNDPEETWRHLMTGADWASRKLDEMREQTAGLGVPLALTESHYSMPGRNRCDLMAAWATGVAYARILNLYQRNGDVLKIATLADFCGTRWMCNAVILPTPGEKNAYMMPVARVMSLFRRHGGGKAVRVKGSPPGLDVSASRTGGRVWLHVANTLRTKAVKTPIDIEGMCIVEGKAFEIAAEPELEVWWRNSDRLAPVEKKLSVPRPQRSARRAASSGQPNGPDRAGAAGRAERGLSPTVSWTFPAASVTAVELKVSRT